MTTLSNKSTDDCPVLTRAETAEILKVDVRTVTRGIEEGTIPAFRVGRRVLIPKKPLYDLLGQTDQARAPIPVSALSDSK